MMVDTKDFYRQQHSQMSNFFHKVDNLKKIKQFIVILRRSCYAALFAGIVGLLVSFWYIMQAHIDAVLVLFWPSCSVALWLVGIWLSGEISSMYESIYNLLEDKFETWFHDRAQKSS